jgi:hypothetical protein
MFINHIIAIALREIHKEQNRVYNKNVITVVPFRRLVKQITYNLCNKDYRF